jgi:UDP-glucose 4-epimerase
MSPRILVTGGAGFIGSHLVDMLVQQHAYVTVFDNLSSGSSKNLQISISTDKCHLIKGDLKNPEEIENALRNVDVVYHFAANAEVRDAKPDVHFRENQVTTFNLLESMRKSGTCKVIFASTSTIYGDAHTQPTPETYGPLFPISTYGASKLACEAMITSYAYTYGVRGLIFRLGNVVGSRANHGVIVDFLKKLRHDSGLLEILGDGNQTKSYIHVSDCVFGILLAAEKFFNSNLQVDAYNLSSVDRVSARRIAEIVVEETGLKPEIRTLGGVDGGRGWAGDVKVMQLSVQKLQSIGWTPRHNSEAAIRRAIRELRTMQ